VIIGENRIAKILMLSDSPTTVTGYATITRNILNGLTEKGHECFCIGHNYFGQDLLPGTTFKDGTQIKFNLLGTGKAPYAQDILQQKIKELKPDIFAVLLDTFMLYPWSLQQDWSPAKTIFYFPSDGENRLPLNCENILKKFHVPVAMARFGQRQALAKHNLKTECIPHACDIKNYFPLLDEQKQALKTKYGLQGKYVVGGVFRNQGRKMPDRMILAFKKFAEGKDDVVLFLHTDPQDGAATNDLQNYIQELGIQNKVRFSGMTFVKGFDYKDMNEVYNIMDTFFLSTSGEGFGVPTIEAMACGVPVAITDFTTTHELLIEDGICGIPIKCCTEFLGNWNVTRGVMDIDAGAEALETLYQSKELREQYGKVGIEKVRKIYSWDVVIPMWDKLIKKMVDE